MSADPKSIGIMVAGLALPALLSGYWLSGAAASLKASPDDASEVAIASAAEDEYCTPGLKKVLRRVAGACGLLEGGGRGCAPADVKNVAAVSGEDFNALFKPLSHRVSIVQFDHDNPSLDDGARKAVEEAWSDQGGASFFFVVARASPEGDPGYNQTLSQKRAEAVLGHLEERFEDPDLKRQVGLMSLGGDFAQLGQEFCDLKRSRGGDCGTREINRSAFVAWIDCAI